MTEPLEKFVESLSAEQKKAMPQTLEDFEETYRIAQLFNISIEEARECR